MVGSFGNLDRGSRGWGTVLDFNDAAWTTAGDDEGHETGVVVAVEALQGAGDSVNLVEGLLMVLMDDGGSG